MAPLPYAPPSFYGYRGGERISDLLLHQGDIAANGAVNNANIWGQTINSLGNIGAHVVDQIGQQKQAEKREKLFTSALQTWDPKDPQGSVMRLATVIPPDEALKFGSGLMAFQSAQEKQKQGQRMTPQEFSAAVHGAAVLYKQAPGEFSRNYGGLRETLGPEFKQQFGYDMPEAPNEEVTKFLTDLGNPTPKEGASHVVGNALVSDKGDVLYQGESKPGSLEQLLLDASAKGDKATYQKLLGIKRDLASAGREPQAPETDQPLSDAATQMAARRYLIDGTLPAFGMGRQGAANKKRVLEAAATIDPNANVAGNAASFAADKSSLGKMQGMVDAVTAFEGTASKNAKLLDGILDKIPNYGSTYANMPARALSQKLGSEDMTTFNTLRQSVANEYARIISNPGLAGVMSDSAREEGAVLLDPNATASQIRAAIKALAAEARNRHTEYQGQLDTIKGRIGGGKSSSTGSPSSGAPPKRVRFDAQGNIVTGGQ